MALLQSNFTSISRIGIVFTSNAESPKTFLDNKPLFEVFETEPYSENLQFIINIINEFQIQNIDYLACDTLSYSAWSNYYQLLTQTTGVVVGASNDKTGNIKYGGDWVLESTSQDIESIYFTQNIEYYNFLLDNVTPWLTGIGVTPWYLYVYGTYMYLTSLSGNTIYRIDLTAGTPTLSSYISMSGPSGVIINGSYMYAAGYNSNSIRRFSLPGLSFTDVVTSGLSNPFGLAISGNYLYIANAGSGGVVQMNLTDNSTSSFVTGLSSPYGLAISGNYMYTATFAGNSIKRIDMTTKAVTNYVTSGLTQPVGLIINDNYLYAANVNSSSGGFISQINLSTGVNVLYSSFPSSKLLEGITIYQTNLYVTSISTQEIYQIALPTVTASPITCFKDGSLILTDKGYKPIQDLRPGHLVKTFVNGYVPIDMIGKRNIVHNALDERIKDQLYELSPDKYLEVFEPLVLTGCHSILVEEYEDEDQKQKTIEVNGNTYITDDRYRLPACADLRASVYENPGTYTVYHLALENEDYYMNYGIYANGLLVETCSKRMLKEISGMELIK